DLAGPHGVEGRVEAEPLGGDGLAAVVVRRRPDLLQPGGEVEVVPLVREAWRAVEDPEGLEHAGLVARLLLQLAPRAVGGVLTGNIELAGRDLEEVRADGMAVLADQQDRTVFERDDRRGPRVADDL